MANEKIKRSGIDILGNLPWGTYLCFFYQNNEDLTDILIPYFKAGLEENAYCVWVVSDPLDIDSAKMFLKKSISNLDEYIKKGRIKLILSNQWNAKTSGFEPAYEWTKKGNGDKVVDQFLSGGNTGRWFDKKSLKDIISFERSSSSLVNKRKVIAVCTYQKDRCGIIDMMDIIQKHKFVIIKRNNKWECVENSERRKAEQEIRLLSNAVGSAIDAIAVTDTEFNIVYVNEALEKLYGYENSEIIGKPISILNPDMKISKKILESMNEKGSWAGEAIQKKKNKEIFTAFLSFSIIRDEYGKTEAMMGAVRDITESCRDKDVLIKQKKELEKKSIALKEILAQIEIEKREIWNNVSCNVESIIRPLLDKIEKEASGKIAGYVELLDSNLGKLTSPFSKIIVSPRSKLSPREIEISDMIRNGYRNKKIAKLLNLSEHTVQTHRRTIRKKLGIYKKSSNLSTFLQTL